MNFLGLSKHQLWQTLKMIDLFNILVNFLQNLLLNRKELHYTSSIYEMSYARRLPLLPEF